MCIRDSLIAELTGGYDLFLPLMIVSVSSYLTSIMFEPHSIDSMLLAKKGELLTHHKDKAILTSVSYTHLLCCSSCRQPFMMVTGNARKRLGFLLSALRMPPVSLIVGYLTDMPFQL